MSEDMAKMQRLALAEREWNYWREAIKRMQKDTPTSYKQFEKLIDRLAECETD